MIRIYFFKRVLQSIALILLLFHCQSLAGQQLLEFIENCKDCIGQVKQVKVKQKSNPDDYRSPLISRVETYDENSKLSKTEFFLDRRITKTIHYKYIDSLLIYEQHVAPGQKEYFLVYQYYQKKIPRKIIKVDKKRRIIDYARIEYSENYVPVYLNFFNLYDELQAKWSLEYFGNNTIILKYFNPDSELSQLQKYERLCKFNNPKKLKKRDFKDEITRPINLIKKDNLVTIVKAVMVNDREQIRIDEITYDEVGNWILKNTFELKKNKNKRRLIKKIEREIEYY